MKKLCKYCGKEKEETQFEVANKIKGTIYRRLKCATCKQDRQRERRHEIRDKFYTYKKQLICSICGNSDYRVLQFHHLDPEQKEHNVGDLIGQGRSMKNILKEISKCKVLCANCHIIEHFTFDNDKFPS